MSMNLTVYVGPYLVVERGAFDWYDFAEFVIDGRMEAAGESEDLFLIPNRKLDGIERQMSWDRHSECPVAEIQAQIRAAERLEFMWLAAPVIQHCKQADIPCRVCWGVVPRWA